MDWTMEWPVVEDEVSNVDERIGVGDTSKTYLHLYVMKQLTVGFLEGLSVGLGVGDSYLVRSTREDREDVLCQLQFISVQCSSVDCEAIERNRRYSKEKSRCTVYTNIILETLYSRLVSWKEHAKADRVKRGSGSEEEVHKRECS